MYVLKACRTPLGALGGSLREHTAPALAGAVLGALLAGFDPALVEACVLGQAVQAGAGANPAGQAARMGGLPALASAFTLNQGCASGLQAVLLACGGAADLAVAGGMESASSAPFLLPTARWGTRMGSAPVLDALILDACWPRREEGRYEADRKRALRAREAGFLGLEIVPLGTDRDDLPPAAGALLPADGAALVLLGSERGAAGHAPLARIVASARGEGEAEAVERALLKAGLALGAVDRFELDAPGAFPDLPGDRVNAWGSALALGLAPGAEGARKLVTLTHQLRVGKLRYGLAALEADGIGWALILENLP